MSSPGHPQRHILAILSSLGGGGAERVMVSLVTGWRGRGYDVTLLTLDSATGDAYRVPTGISRIALGLTGQSGNPVAAIAANVRRLIALRQAIRRVHPALVVSFTDRTNVRVLLASRGLGIPVVVSERIDPEAQEIGWVWRLLRRLTYPLSDALVMQTEELRTWAEGLVGSDRVAVIPNPIAVPPSEGDGSQQRERMVLAAGRLVPQKGFDLLLDAFGAIAGEFPDWHLIILGDGPGRVALEARVSAAGLAQRVILPGWIAEPSAYFRRAGVFVLSSRFEGFPNVLVEAMAEGCAVLASDCRSGPAEIIHQGIDGILIESGSVEAIARGLRTMLRDAGLRERLAARAPSVRERFGMESVLDRWETVATGVLRRRGVTG